jgi:hypothetical protein
MKTTLQVEDDLLLEFQRAVMEEYGKLKGAQSEALAEAMKLWLAFKGRRRFFAVAGPSRLEIMSSEEMKKMLVNSLSRGSVSFYERIVVPLFDSFDRGELFEVVEAVKEVLGDPLEATSSIEDIEHDDDIVVFTWRVKEEGWDYTLKFQLRVSLGFIGFSRALSKKVMDIKRLTERLKEEDLKYDVTRVEPTFQPTPG